ncbi:MAG: LrgB family protein [Alistipes sp.]
MNEIIYSQIFLLTLTVGVYLGAVQLRRRVNCALLHPILVSVAVLIAFVKLTGMPYEHYMRQTQIIDFLLGLSVVALGYVLHDQIYNIRGNVLSIVIAIVTGSAVGILSVALIARWMGAEPAVVASLEPKSVTTAIALSLSANSGGIPALTSVVVIVVGVFGGIVGPGPAQAGVESRIARDWRWRRGARDGRPARWSSAPSRSDQRTGDRPDGRRHAVLVPILENHLNETLTRIPKPGLRPFKP